MSIESDMIKLGLAEGIDIARMRESAKWDYDSADARIAATCFTPRDVGHVACQLDDNSFWELTAIAPITWVNLGVGVVQGEHIAVGLVAKGDKGDKGDQGEPGVPGAAQAGAVPFYKADGAQVTLPVSNGALSFYKADGSLSAIPVNGS